MAQPTRPGTVTTTLEVDGVEGAEGVATPEETTTAPATGPIFEPYTTPERAGAAAEESAPIPEGRSLARLMATGTLAKKREFFGLDGSDGNGDGGGGGGKALEGNEKDADTSRAAKITRMLGGNPLLPKMIEIDKFEVVRIKPDALDESSLGQLEEKGLTIVTINPDGEAICLNAKGHDTFKELRYPCSYTSDDIYWNGNALAGGGIQALLSKANRLQGHTVSTRYEAAKLKLREIPLHTAPHSKDSTQGLETIVDGQQCFVIATELYDDGSNTMQIMQFQKAVSEIAEKYELAVTFQLGNRAIIANTNEKGGAIELFQRELEDALEDKTNLRSTTDFGDLAIHGDTEKLLMPNETAKRLNDSLGTTEFGAHTISAKALGILNERDPQVKISSTDRQDGLKQVTEIADADLLRALCPDVYINQPTGQAVVNFLTRKRDYLQFNDESTLLVKGPAGSGKSANVAAALRGIKSRRKDIVVIASAGVDRNNLGEVYTSTTSLFEELGRLATDFPEKAVKIADENPRELGLLIDFISRRNDPDYSVDIRALAVATAVVQESMIAEGLTVVRLRDDALRYGQLAGEFERQVKTNSDNMLLIATERDDIPASAEELPKGEEARVEAIEFLDENGNSSAKINKWFANEINKAQNGGAIRKVQTVDDAAIKALVELAGGRNTKTETDNLCANPLRVQRVIRGAVEVRSIEIDASGVCRVNVAELITQKERLEKAGKIEEITSEQVRILADRYDVQETPAIIIALEGISRSQIDGLPVDVKKGIGYFFRAGVATLDASGRLVIDPLWSEAIKGHAANHIPSASTAKTIYGILSGANPAGTKLEPRTADPITLFKLGEYSQIDASELIPHARTGIAVAFERGDFEQALTLAEYLDINISSKNPADQLLLASTWASASNETVKVERARTMLNECIKSDVESIRHEAARVLMRLEAKSSLLSSSQGDRTAPIRNITRAVRLGDKFINPELKTEAEIYDDVADFLTAVRDPDKIDSAALRSTGDSLVAKCTIINDRLNQPIDPKLKNRLVGSLVIAYSTLQRIHSQLARLSDKDTPLTDSKITAAIKSDGNGKNAINCGRSIKYGSDTLAFLPLARDLDASGSIGAQAASNIARATLLAGVSNGQLNKILRTVEAQWATCNDKKFTSFLMSQVVAALETTINGMDKSEPQKAELQTFYSRSCRKAYEPYAKEVGKITIGEDGLSEAAFTAAYNYAEDLLNQVERIKGRIDTTRTGEVGVAASAVSSSTREALGEISPSIILKEANSVLRALKQNTKGSLASTYGSYLDALIARGVTLDR